MCLALFVLCLSVNTCQHALLLINTLLLACNVCNVCHLRLASLLVTHLSVYTCQYALLLLRRALQEHEDTLITNVILDGL